MSLRRSLAVLLLLMAPACSLFGDPEDRYTRCMFNAGFIPYDEAVVSHFVDGEVQVLSITKPSPDSDKPGFQAKSRECLERAGGEEHLIIISD